MTDLTALENMAKTFLLILRQKSADSVNVDNLAIDYNNHIDQRLTKHLKILCDTAELLVHAKKNNDEITVRTALSIIYSRSMSLSNFFEAITEDSELIFHTPGWPEIPEDYKIPDHYHYPHK